MLEALLFAAQSLSQSVYACKIKRDMGERLSDDCIAKLRTLPPRPTPSATPVPTAELRERSWFCLSRAPAGGTWIVTEVFTARTREDDLLPRFHQRLDATGQRYDRVVSSCLNSATPEVAASRRQHRIIGWDGMKVKYIRFP